jgi:glycosyltransferase involved in cell wall biosynthesis
MLKKVPKYVDEVIVMDNNSTDKTAVIAKKLGAKVITEKRKDKYGIGYGFAHQKGMKVATGDVIVTMDGDGTYPVSQIKNAIEYLDSQALDFVVCSRFPLSNSKAISKLRQLGVTILNAEVKWLYNYHMTDILSGMWVVTKRAARKLKIREGGWDLSPEIKLSALNNKSLRFGEFHIDHDHRDNGASKQQLWVTGTNHLKYIAKRRLTTDRPWKNAGKKFWVPGLRLGWE